MRDDTTRRSFWMLRVLEWNDPKAKYPNLWTDGLPSTVLVFDTIATRLRLGDLIAVFHPASSRHPARSERFVGLVRVAGLRRAERSARSDRYWLDLDPAHRYRRPVDLGSAPRRVFLCCDPGWPETERAMFEKLHAIAMSERWSPLPGEDFPAVEAGKPSVSDPIPDERSETAVVTTPVEASAAEPPSEPAPADEPEPIAEPEPQPIAALDSTPESAPAEVEPSGTGEPRWFGGVSWAGDRRDPRDGSWFALATFDGASMRVVRLEPTGRTGVQAYLRDPDRDLSRVEATGCAFPFGQPQAFVEHVVDGPFPEEGWWGVAKAFEHIGYTAYLRKVQEFRDRAGAVARYVDDRVGMASPLSRDHGDRASMSFHGIRMVAADRSRFAIRPFESAQGRLLLEVAPDTAIREFGLDGATRDAGGLLDALASTGELPLVLDGPLRARCVKNLEAVRAVLAARCAARAVLSGETDKTPEELAPDAPEQVRREGWIYGVAS